MILDYGVQWPLGLPWPVALRYLIARPPEVRYVPVDSLAAEPSEPATTERKGRAGRPATKRPEPRWPSDPVEAGRACGRRHGNDPWRMAGAMGIPVKRVSHEEMARIRGAQTSSDRIILGHVHKLDGKWMIAILDSLGPRDSALTLGHELGHVVNENWTESQCDAFAEALTGAG